MIKLDLSTEEMKDLTHEEIEIAKARKLELLILPYLRRDKMNKGDLEQAILERQ